GGVGANQWAVAQGTLPAGLSLSTAGVISGTPTTPGSSTFNVQVKDSVNTIAVTPLTITVDPAALAVTTASLPNGTVGTAYSQTLTATGGAGGNQWTVAPGTLLPAGLSLSAAVGSAHARTPAAASNCTAPAKG